MSKAKKLALKAAKDARGGGHFLPIPLAVLRSPELAGLSPYAAKLLWDIASQWRLGQNGDANAAFEKVMRSRGWRSKATLNKAIKELLESGLIVRTRQGSLHQCSLYALGWLAIDECSGKLDIRPTCRPLRNWAEKNSLPSTPGEPKRLIAAGLGTPRVPDG
jgi:DNA-binding HxlR family transcriptional regulator